MVCRVIFGDYNSFCEVVLINKAYLGIDIGGTGAKAGVYDKEGVQLGFAGRSYQPVTDSHGLTEIPIEDIYIATRNAVREAVAKAGAKIGALAISSQGQTFVSMDSNDQPLHRAILWYDARAGAQAQQLRETIGEGSISPLLEAVASAPKIMWMREHYPEAMRTAARYLLLPDYIYYKLTGRPATDPCIASSSGLYSDTEPDYNPAALKAAGIDKSELAQILPSATAFAKISAEAAQEWGLDKETVAVIGTNDQYAGALGAGNCRPGIVSETTGTCLALVTLTEQEPQQAALGLISGKFPLPDYWFILAYSKTAGVALDWVVRELCGCTSHAELDRQAAGIAAGSGGVTALHHLDGFISPYLNEGARGSIHGLNLNTRSVDIYNAFLESMCYSSRQHVDSYKKCGYEVSEFRCIGGGAKSDHWMQMKADVLGMAVERPEVVEAATLGAAMLAATGMGEYESIKSASEAMHKPGRIFVPQSLQTRVYDSLYSDYLELFQKMY